MRRISTFNDTLNTGVATVDLGDGIQVPIRVDGVYPGQPGPPGAGVPTGGSTGQVIRKKADGSAEWFSLTATTVGLPNVDNTSDYDKPVSDAQRTFVTSLVDIAAPLPTGNDDTALLNEFFALHPGERVRLRADTVYRVDGTLNLPPGTSLTGYGATLDCRNMPAGTSLGQRIAVSAAGALDALLPIVNPIAAGSRVVSGISSTSSLSVGDLVLIRNAEPAVAGMTRLDRSKGELNIVRSVDSATQVTLASSALFPYAASSLELLKVEPTKDATIEGVTILMGGVGSAHCGVQVQYGQNVTVQDVTVTGAEDTAINLRMVWGGQALRNILKDSTGSSAVGVTGYGVSVVEGSRYCLVEGNEIHNVRHAVTGGGYWPASFIDIRSNTATRTMNAAYDTHESCFYWTFTGNKAVGVSAGFGMRGQYVTVEDNEVMDTTGLAYEARTYDGVIEQRGIRFISNRATRCAAGLTLEGLGLGGEPNSAKINCEVVNNKLTDCGTATVDAFVIRHFDGLTVRGNSIVRPGRNGMLILGLSTVSSKNLTIDGNEILSAPSNGIEMQFVDDVMGSAGKVVSPVKSGLQMTTCNRTSFTGFTTRTPGQFGIYIVGGTVHGVIGAQISGNTHVSYDAIRTSGATDLTVSGGYLSSGRYGVYATTSDYVAVTGVNLRGNTNAARLNVDATNKVVANNIM